MASPVPRTPGPASPLSDTVAKVRDTLATLGQIHADTQNLSTRLTRLTRWVYILTALVSVAIILILVLLLVVLVALFTRP